MPYSIQYNKVGSLAATLLSGATSTTLSASTFGSPSGSQLYVVDYDNGSAELISATVAGTAVTGITRGLSGGAAGTTDHQVNATIASVFLPQHYDRVSTRTLGYSQITSGFTWTGTSVNDVTGLSVTVTVPTNGARIRITAWCRALTTDAGGATNMFANIQEGATVLATNLVTVPAANSRVFVLPSYTAVATAGSHTYKLTVQEGTAGNHTLDAGATYPAFILVENIE